MLKPRLSLMALLLAALACNAVQDFIELEGPEDRATDVVGTEVVSTDVVVTDAVATQAPPTAAGTQAVVALPGDLPFTLDEADDVQAALLPEFAADAGALPEAPRYVLDVAVSFNGDEYALIEGRSAIRYTNTQDFALEDLVLMLWPNERNQYLGQMDLEQVAVNGVEIEPALEHGGLAARLPLDAPLEPGAQVEVTTEFSVEAFGGLEQGARFGLTRGVLIAPTFYPLIPRLVQGEWQAAPPPAGGDTTNSDSAFFAYRVSAPAEMEVAASGSLVDSLVSGEAQTLTYVAGPMRDLALVVGGLERRQAEAGGVLINAYLLPSHAPEADAMLEQAVIQMENLQARVGPYPFAELDIVDAPGAFGGIEYPGLVLIGVVAEGFFERANVHEVGHQWFYSLVGDDQLLEPWLDEAAASYTEALYAEAAFGPEAYQDAIDGFWQYLAAANDPETPIGLPVDAYDGTGDYGLIVYGKGALFFDALRRELGDETFFAFLQNYYATYRYGFATSEGFQTVAEDTCACDLDALFDLWVYQGGPVERP